jgi:hypothetical protein
MENHKSGKLLVKDRAEQRRKNVMLGGDPTPAIRSSKRLEGERVEGES